MDEILLWSKASAYCAKSEHCEQEVRAKLQAWTAGEAVVSKDAENQLIQRLYREDYLNEVRYARAYAHDKLRYALWGRKKIALMLRMKGISSERIAAALDALPEDEYEQAKQKVLETKRRQLGAAAGSYEGKIKVLRFLAAHGF